MYRAGRLGNRHRNNGVSPKSKKRFALNVPEQVIDYLGMMGDASDIPGLPGVGDKNAKNLLKGIRCHGKI